MQRTKLITEIHPYISTNRCNVINNPPNPNDLKQQNNKMGDFFFSPFSVSVGEGWGLEGQNRQGNR